MDKMERLRGLIEAELDASLSNLARHANSLGTDLVKMARDIEDKGRDAFINSVGVIQTQGSIIESQCGRISALQKMLRNMYYVNKE